MNVERRSFLETVTLVFGAVSALLAEQGTNPPKFPPSLRGAEPEPLPKPDPRMVLKANQKELRKDVERLAELAEELKKEMEKTDSTEILSVSLVRKAEEIEKLAKHVKTLARG